MLFACPAGARRRGTCMLRFYVPGLFRRLLVILLPALLVGLAAALPVLLHSEAVLSEGHFPSDRSRPLPGLLPATLSAPATVMPDWLREAALFADSGPSLELFEEADDDDREAFESVARFFPAQFPAQSGNAASSATFATLNSRAFWQSRLRPIFVRAIVDADQNTWQALSLRFGGILLVGPRGEVRPLTALPQRFLPAEYSGPQLYRDVLDLWQNPKRPQELWLINKHNVLRSLDGGESFTVFDVPAVVRRATLTAISARIDAEGNVTDLYLGSALRGVTRCAPGNALSGCYQILRGLPNLHHQDGAYFYEEISGLVYDQAGERLLATTSFQPGLFALARGAAAFTRMELPGLNPEIPIQNLLFDPGTRTAWISTEGGLLSQSLDDGSWHSYRWESLKAVRRTEATVSRPISWTFATTMPGGRIGFTRTRSPAVIRAPRNIRALYVSPTSARERQTQVFDLLDRFQMNAVVIDVKDDYGRLVYGSNLPEAVEMNNHRPLAPIRELVARLKERNVYVIARQVVFKDARAFAYQGNRYAIIDRTTGGPWAYEEVERWVDTYAEWIHNYNVRVAREVVELGFDEVQFDYIRFPSDGPIGNGHWRFRRGDAYRSEALESFLMKARSELNVPISIDIYGYHAMYRSGAVIGQDVVDMGEFVDVVSPMHYSSHFGDNYLDHIHPREARTHELLRTGVERPIRIGSGRFLVRPWLQAFRMRTGPWGWGEPYMESQMLGAIEGGAAGFLWWGPIQDFYMPGRVQARIFQ